MFEIKPRHPLVEPMVEAFRKLPLDGDEGCNKLTDCEWRQVAEAALETIELSYPL